MQDVRIRSGIAIVLSWISFLSIEGAVVAFIWWALFCDPRKILTKTRGVLPLFITVLFFCGIMEITVGGGISYGVRMSVIIVIGAWLYCDYRKGEYLHLGSWLFGNGIGFDLGMIAEMGMQTIDTLNSDFIWIRRAQKLKNTKPGIHTLIPTGLILVNSSLKRAENAAGLMSVRGYTKGGSFKPEFYTSRTDIIGAVAAAFLVIISFIPASEFFILYR